MFNNVALANQVFGNVQLTYKDSNGIRHTRRLTLGEEASINGLKANAIAATLHFKFDTTRIPSLVFNILDREVQAAAKAMFPGPGAVAQAP